MGDILYICESCQILYPIEEFHLNYPLTILCDVCSLVVNRCEICYIKWTTNDKCENCESEADCQND